MLALIWKWNRWFDDLPEPQRFLTFLAFVAIPYAISVAFWPFWGIGFAAILFAMRFAWLRKNGAL